MIIEFKINDNIPVSIIKELSEFLDEVTEYSVTVQTRTDSVVDQTTIRMSDSDTLL